MSPFEAPITAAQVVDLPRQNPCWCRVTTHLLLYFAFLLITICNSPLLGGNADNLTEIEEKFLEQYKLYKELQEKVDQHPVTKWRREIARNKKAIVILEKQLRDMVRLENIEPIEELRQKNKSLQKQIEAKKKDWEALVKKLDAARDRLKTLKKQLDPTWVEEMLKGQVK